MEGAAGKRKSISVVFLMKYSALPDMAPLRKPNSAPTLKLMLVSHVMSLDPFERKGVDTSPSELVMEKVSVYR